MIKLKDIMNEGKKRDYSEAYEKFYGEYKKFANATMDVAKSATEISGEKVDEKIILKNFKKQVIPFIGLMSSWNKGHQSNAALDETIEESPDSDMFRALNQVNNDIFKIMNKYDGKADMDAIFRSWMLGIHAHLKKAGIKLK
jgi:hypothetical protein